MKNATDVNQANKPKSCCCSAKKQEKAVQQADSRENKQEQVTTDKLAEVTLIIEGAGCASCVGKIESALKSVDGVVSAEMNFAQRTVSVSGNASEKSLIKAVEHAGYNAKFSNSESEEDALEEKERADWQYYKTLMRKMTIALALGIPLMVYSLFVGEMTVRRADGLVSSWCLYTRGNGRCR